MARVYFNSSQQRMTGGVAQVEIVAATVRELVAELENRFPGLSAHLDGAATTAVAIDGDIIPDATYEPLTPDAEVHFVAPLVGG